MNLQEIAIELIKFHTQTGNIDEINKAITYLSDIALAIKAYKEIYQKGNLAPVILLSNGEKRDFDVLLVGHIDVVPAADNMFVPNIKDGKMYGRGTLDMKSFAAVGLKLLEYVISEKLPLKFGVLLSSDEEKGSFGLEAFLADNKDLKAKIVLDVDVAGNINKIVTRCKNPVFIKLISTGKEAHGSTPWQGIDANEQIFQSWQNIRKFYPYYNKKTPVPLDTWIDTVHFAKINGGEVANVISNYAEALLDFRLTEKSTLKDLESNLKRLIAEGVDYQVISSGSPVIMKEDNFYISRYKQIAEQYLQQPIEFEYIGGATDSRAFAERGSIIIMHSGSGAGMHAKDEYVEWQSVEQLFEIQKLFLRQLTLNPL